MMYREIIKIDTKKDEYYDITDKIENIIEKSKFREGLCNIFLTGTTAGMIINENEQMLMGDFKRYFQSINEKRLYNHPDNGFSHLRAAMVSQDKTIPVSNGKMILGTWQKIILWEFDTQSRNREIVVTINGL